MAICYSSAWDSKVVIGAWWVESHQVTSIARRQHCDGARN